MKAHRHGNHVQVWLGHFRMVIIIVLQENMVIVINEVVFAFAIWVMVELIVPNVSDLILG